MIRKVFIPNRGEIAVRIIKSAHELGIKTVVSLSELEKNTIPAQISDEVHYFKEGPFSENYLNIPLIIQLAKQYNADAIHPGYGFLAENHQLVLACENAGITFVGPSANNLKQMGDKQQAREIAKQANVPITPSWEGAIENILAASSEFSYPVLIKAAMGGGGKGMVICHNADELTQQLPSVSRQALKYFGDDRVYVEKYIESPRHIEVQVLGDEHGNTLHFYERECSIQRRFQKIIEEAPAPSLSDAKRQELTQNAIELCEAIGYKSAGTLEFLVDKDGNHYFLEMNTRIQVEHCVTEEVTGIDLVKWQFRIANGEALNLHQEDIKLNGYAIEARIYAENPSNNFTPSPGKITDIILPSLNSYRLEIGFQQPTEIHPQFDPMIAKFIVHRFTREEAIEDLSNRIGNTVLHGIDTNIHYLLNILGHEDFANGDIHTHFCHTEHDTLIAQKQSIKDYSVLAYALLRLNPKKGINGLWRQLPQVEFEFEDQKYVARLRKLKKGWQIDIQGESHYIESYNIDSNSIQIALTDTEVTAYYFNKNEQYNIIIKNQQHHIKALDILPSYHPDDNSKQFSGNELLAPLPGQVAKILVEEGQEVKTGDVLVILEAMKMENHLNAWKDTTIEKIHIDNGAQVIANQLLITTD